MTLGDVALKASMLLLGRMMGHLPCTSSTDIIVEDETGMAAEKARSASAEAMTRERNFIVGG